ncbi:MAG TPA: DUF5317 domain-containing protein [Candidatus Limnocylindrales bacterium]|nr:DUF5317 domain-containing protein [Candidatus Limnocylindrales bacterium]
MFMLWAIPVGIAVGLLVGGRLGNLSSFRFRWAWLAIAGLLVQVVLFSPTGGALAGDLGPAIYLASTAAVLVAVLRNLRQPGMAVVALGSVANFAAISVNGGFMPASAEALTAAGLPPGDHLNSIVVANPALRPLTDIYAIPAGLPMANVFSVGDVLIALGIIWTIAAAMRRRGLEPGLRS